MTGILGDYNCEGHVATLIAALDAGGWRELWDALALKLLTFTDLGLPGTTPDDELWRLCQREGLVLVTANRNADGPDSLEVVIRAENEPGSLPVFTFADPRRILKDREYTTKVAERLLDFLTRIDDVRGTGRLYLP